MVNKRIVLSLILLLVAISGVLVGFAEEYKGVYVRVADVDLKTGRVVFDIIGTGKYKFLVLSAENAVLYSDVVVLPTSITITAPVEEVNEVKKIHVFYEVIDLNTSRIVYLGHYIYNVYAPKPIISITDYKVTGKAGFVKLMVTTALQTNVKILLDGVMYTTGIINYPTEFNITVPLGKPVKITVVADTSYDTVKYESIVLLSPIISTATPTQPTQTATPSQTTTVNAVIKNLVVQGNNVQVQAYSSTQANLQIYVNNMLKYQTVIQGERTIVAQNIIPSTPGTYIVKAVLKSPDGKTLSQVSTQYVISSQAVSQPSTMPSQTTPSTGVMQPPRINNVRIRDNRIYIDVYAPTKSILTVRVDDQVVYRAEVTGSREIPVVSRLLEKKGKHYIEVTISNQYGQDIYTKTIGAGVGEVPVEWIVVGVLAFLGLIWYARQRGMVTARGLK